jgi:chlorinating enzyme
MPTPADHKRLSDDQVAHYREQGYLIVDRPLLVVAKFKRLAAHFERLLDQWAAESGRSPEHMDTPHFRDPALFEWLFDEDILDVVESVIGPDIALFSSHFICKPAAVGKRVPWHEDAVYWDKLINPVDVVTVWLAIDPSTHANGCMRVIPGTHRGGGMTYEAVDDAGRSVFNSQIRAEQVDESKAVDMLLEPNHCSLHHANIVHGSAANSGAMRRCGYTMRYMPTTVKFTPSDDMDFAVYLARGKDHAGNTYGDPSKPLK